MIDKTSLSYWFPIIARIGLPVPKTSIIPMPQIAQDAIWKAFDGAKGLDGAEDFFSQIDAAASILGYPCFLRTDMTSGKHFWENTCFLKSAKDIPHHVYAIAEFSELAQLIGLDWRTWVVRELLPTIPFGVCPKYRNMPICKEFRFFVEDEKVKCFHPYWPLFCLEKGGVKTIDYVSLCKMDNQTELMNLASRAGKAVGGTWSIDVLETRKGWYITDMAEASKSFHWKECPNSFKKEIK